MNTDLTKHAQSRGSSTHELLTVTADNIEAVLLKLGPARGSAEKTQSGEPGACKKRCKNTQSLGHFEVEEPEADNIRFKEIKHCLACEQMFVEDQKTSMKYVRGTKREYILALLAKQEKRSAELNKPLELKLWTPRQKTTELHEQPEMQLAASTA